ncbi:MAG TPA: alpha/beta hydrolase [Anaerolineales bacterium]
MAGSRIKACLVNVDRAQIYCEIAGKGTPLVMIHAAVADCRQWNSEFAYFANKYQVLRYDTRGHGKSDPVEGEYSDMRDLQAVLDTLAPRGPVVLMGCSRGGGLALDYALEHPDRVQALIMVGSGPGGLDLDVPESPKHADAQKAWRDGDIDRAAELETQIWFDGTGRTAQQVDHAARKLAYAMDRLALGLEARNLGKRLPNTDRLAFERLAQIKIPVLLVVGEFDEPYLHAATDYMIQRIPSARRVVMNNAAHLSNMEHPGEFQRFVDDFLEGAKT